MRACLRNSSAMPAVIPAIEATTSARVDLVTGQPPKLGLGLWNHPMIEMPLEIAITMGALWLYARATGGLRLSIYVLAGILLILQGINWFGPVATIVDANTTWLAWFAYGLATLAAWWAARPVSARPSGTV